MTASAAAACGLEGFSVAVGRVPQLPGRQVVAARKRIGQQLLQEACRTLTGASPPVYRDPRGRPVSSGSTELSLAHSGVWAVAMACSDSAVGIDVEEVQRFAGLDGEDFFRAGVPVASGSVSVMARAWCEWEARTKHATAAAQYGPSQSCLFDSGRYAAAVCFTDSDGARARAVWALLSALTTELAP